MADPRQRRDAASDPEAFDPSEPRRSDPRGLEAQDTPEPSWNEHDGSFEWGPEADDR
ncbi:MAG TPA: hypothetical protein VF802_03645 [Candidatus Limnocylindrales bacterium]